VVKPRIAEQKLIDPVSSDMYVRNHRRANTSKPRSCSVNISVQLADAWTTGLLYLNHDMVVSLDILDYSIQAYAWYITNHFQSTRAILQII
jgi:hypothetical protein